MKQRTYLAIDLKSFYASVECRERGLDPMDTNLVVADESRTEKTICLAVTPPLKAWGVPGRARLFEVAQRVRQANALRRRYAPQGRFTGSSCVQSELDRSPELAIGYLIAPPRMAHYMEYSTRVYQVYLKYVAPEDMIVYSIDEVFLDVTNYLQAYRLSPRQLAMRIILDVLADTGITATAGIGTNLYLCKVAMDIMAKRIPADENGVRIAELDEQSYRRALWAHRPLTDFWRVGRGIAGKLEANGMFTMGDVARCSVDNEDLIYRLFGKNAELLIDHAWGWEPCTIADVRAFRPAASSLGSGQVLQRPYGAEKAKLVLREMADQLALELVEKGLVTDQIVLTVGYDTANLDAPFCGGYRGEIQIDRYGRRKPKHALGTENLPRHTSSARLLIEAAVSAFERVVDQTLLIRRLNLSANHVVAEAEAAGGTAEFEQLDFFGDGSVARAREAQENARLERERKMQQAVLAIRKKYGNNAILKGMSLEEGATARERNRQIGGHRA